MREVSGGSATTLGTVYARVRVKRRPPTRTEEIAVPRVPVSRMPQPNHAHIRPTR